MPFAPDIFSTAVPDWKPTSSAVFSLISKLFSSFIVSKKIYRIDQIGSLEINSSNYRIYLFDGSCYVLKRLSSFSDTLFASLAAQQYLSESCCPITLSIPTLTGSPYLSYSDNFYLLYPYVAGDYYSGSLSELRNTASSIGNMFFVLNAYNRSRIFTSHPPLYTENNSNLLSISNNLSSLSHLPYFDTLPLYIDQIVDTYYHLSSLDLSSSTQLVHIDLHPHNILLQDSKVKSFLDWDSLSLAPLELAVAFAILKLCRQSICNFPNEFDKSSISLEFIESFLPSYNQPLNISQLKFFAKSEVLRRILVILDLAIHCDDISWNHVLPLQLSHLDEIDIIFSNRICS